MPIQLDDVSFQKAGIIERTIKRIQEEYSKDTSMGNETYLDALILNIERACQATIDLSLHIISENHLGIPKNSSDGFRILFSNGFITEKIQKAMISMVGFRNIAIHDYREIDKKIISWIATERYKNWILFCGELGIKIKNGN